ncbi:MAG: exodeoxyribonuclease VII large subunit [Methanosarcinales archaeon]|nr:MAG: exodeoxyribonuclease VII large subunit [Methanosarcinales archaeon]
MLYTVRELTQYVKERLQDDPSLNNISVRGEISNFVHHTSGHMYFTMKDAHSQLNCVMFRGSNKKLRFKPKNGMKVVCAGNITVYEARGVYQLLVWDIQPDGIGALYLAFEQLKEQLSKKGFFDDTHKKPLPAFPETIGIITSRTGAVLHDMINVIRRRFPDVRIILAPTRVQGAGAAAEIAHAIKQMNQISTSRSRTDTHGIDVMIVARGGGSIEELWAFNELTVAEAVFESDIPIISAVGHETDVTICDFVADLRAPTPSAAAELVVPDKGQLTQQVTGLHLRLIHAIQRTVNTERDRLAYIERGVVHPIDRINQHRQYIDELFRQLHRSVLHRLELRRNDLSMLGATLHALSPLNHLQRGYSIVLRMPDLSIVNTVKSISAGRDLQIRVTDGEIKCKVHEIKEIGEHD